MLKRDSLYGDSRLPDFKEWSKELAIAKMKKDPGKRVVMLKSQRPYRFIRVNNHQARTYDILNTLCIKQANRFLDFKIIGSFFNERTINNLIKKNIIKKHVDNNMFIDY